MQKCLLSFTCFLLLFDASLTTAKQTAEHLSLGSGSYQFHDPGTGNELQVWYHRPKAAHADSSVVVVLHGVKRDGDRYRDDWVEASERHNFFLVAPDFRLADYPHGHGYHFGNMFDAEKQLNPKSKWCITTLERIFDDVVQRMELTAKTYGIYGHSAGAQLVHRMILFHPETRINKAVAANAGWYTMPDDEIAYPAGLGETSLETDLQKSFDVKLLILLGDQDNDPHGKYLPSSRMARAQGKHRFERGHHFYDTAQQIAQEQQFSLKWQLQVVPGARHKNAMMVPSAASYLME